MKDKQPVARDAILSLNSDDKKELDELHKDILDSIALSADRVVLDESLMNRIAAFFLYLIERTPLNVDSNGRENLLIFEKLVGFANPKYRGRFEEFIKYSNEYF